jgi:hypothetical protein
MRMDIVNGIRRLDLQSRGGEWALVDGIGRLDLPSGVDKESGNCQWYRKTRSPE